MVLLSHSECRKGHTIIRIIILLLEMSTNEPKFLRIWVLAGLTFVLFPFDCDKFPSPFCLVIFGFGTLALAGVEGNVLVDRPYELRLGRVTSGVVQTEGHQYEEGEVGVLRLSCEHTCSLACCVPAMHSREWISVTLFLLNTV